MAPREGDDMINALRRKPWHSAALLLALLALLGLAARLLHRSHGAEARKAAASDLFTGREPKGDASIYFASATSPMPGHEARAIYLTDSIAARAHQAVQALLQGPKGKGLLPAFPEGASLLGLFIDKQGLCVVDLSLKHPGGTTGEYVSLYCLVHTLADNFPEVQRVQVLLDGQRADTLAGHFDLSQPLDRSSF
jgi:hypothetical protein